VATGYKPGEFQNNICMCSSYLIPRIEFCRRHIFLRLIWQRNA